MGTCVHQISHFLFIFFTFVVMEVCICSGSNNIRVCKEEEMQALLCFKNELEDPMNRLSTWVDGVDCCSKWEGVVCDNATGHVVELQLANPNFEFEFVHLPKGILSPCLHELEQLRHLDLSGLYNYFSGSQIPNFIGSFANLQYLDLSNLGFQGIIPHQLGNLTSLHTLILHNSYFDRNLIKVDSFEWLSNLSNLQLLDLSNANLSLVHNWPEVINMLASLHELHLSDCDLSKLYHPFHCSNSSLQVLDLSFNDLNYVIPSWIFILNNLVYLDLSYCGFLSPFPSGHWNFTSLKTLNIRGNEMTGSLPSQLFGLNCLVSLKLHGNHFQGPLPNSPWNLTSLHILDISNNELNASLPSQLFGLSHLKALYIASNVFQDPLPSGLSNLTSLKILDVSSNHLMNSQIPNWIYDCINLESLNLRDNQLQGTISNSISNLTSLSTLDLSENMLTGEIPKQIGKLSKLRVLDLYENMITGEIPKQIGKLIKLEVLYLFRNMLTGEIPKEIGKLKKLRLLNLCRNMLTGDMANQIGKLNKLQGLRQLDISRNKFFGHLPESLGYSFPLMQSLYIFYNMLEGTVTENHFVNLTKLRYFDAFGNRITMSVSPNWTPPFQLYELYLSGWNLGPQFPAWLQSQCQIYDVDISNAGIESEIPTWFWNFSSQIHLVNLSHNQLRGHIQHISFPPPREESTLLVYLGSNQFSGPLPRISIHITELDLSNNFFSGNVFDFLCLTQNMPYDLRILHLGRNNLSGEIPNCWMHWPHLTVINMGKNQFIGSIPNSIGFLNQLKSLDLHKNMLSGHISSSLQKCTHLLKIDLGENGFTGKIPKWLGTRLSYLTVLRLRSNKFYGKLPPEFCHLTSLHILDLSNNNLFGAIPSCLKNLTAMIIEKDIQDADFEMWYSFYTWAAFGESALVTTKGHEYEFGTTILLLFAGMDLSSNKFTGKIPIELMSLVRLRSLNLSRNNLTGNIPMEMVNMKLLESLDLSRNQLSGKIPPSFSSLSTLSVLDLSYNNLTGKIPLGTQLQGFNASCYIGNNLCGPPLSQECSADDEGEISKHENNGDEDSFEVDMFYVSMAIGFALGFWGVCCYLFFVRPWRIAYSKFLESKLKSFFVWVHVSRA